MMLRRLPILHVLLILSSSYAFTVTSPLSRSSFHGRTFVKISPKTVKKCPRSRSVSLRMFLQDGGGFLGIGAPEIATIAIIGYFVLGPEDLYKLTKEIGKFITNLRSVAAETTATFENTMEDQLQMKEMQSAARELNDAFSFRRSINYDLKEEADILKEVTGDEANVVAAATAVASEEAVSTIKNRKKRRKKKKATPPPVEEIPQELEMPTGDDWFNPESVMTADSLENDDVSRKSRMSRLQQSASNANIDGGSESQNEEFVLPEFSETSEKAATDAAVAKFNSQRDQLENIDPQSMTENGFDTAKYDAVEEANAQARFAAQLSQDWNNSILDNSETLEPLGKIMERLAILEEERAATEKRLEEEFRLRTDLEERFYKEKRQILEEGAAEIQAEAYENVNNKLTNSSSAQNKNLY